MVLAFLRSLQPGASPSPAGRPDAALGVRSELPGGPVELCGWDWVGGGGDGFGREGSVEMEMSVLCVCVCLYMFFFRLR